MPTIDGIDFDTTRRITTSLSLGYTKAQRDGLADAELIKVRDAAVKTNLTAKLTKGLQVSTYNPTDLKDPNNFFNFVSTWESVILQIDTHLKTFHMQSPFSFFKEEVTNPTEAELRDHEFDLSTFLMESAANGGNALSYTDTASGNVVNRPPAPTGTVTLVHDGNILTAWHTLTLDQVAASVRLQVDYVADPVHRQNLSWSFQYIMDGLDADLKAYVLSKIAAIPDSRVGRTGPVAFMIVAQRILHTTENLAQKVINGLISLRLTHFDSENVTEAIFTVRNVLKFLRYGEPNTFAPRTTLVMVYDVFRGSSVGAFRNYVQQAQDIVLADETRIEVIFDHFQSKYEELLLADRWVPTRKKPSAFHLGEATKTYAEADKNKSGNNSNNGNGKGNGKPKERPTHDKSGRAIDYTPPKAGQPNQRTVGDRTEHWCGKCGRWGSHPTDKHDAWKAEMKERRNKNKNKSNNGNSNGNASANAASSNNSTTRGSVTFLSALTGNKSVKFAVDPELAEGIDL